MIHRTALAVASVPLCVGLALTAGPTFAGTATKSTTFAFRASGFGTRVVGGQLPVGSATTGYQGIGCTNQAGRSRTNNVAESSLPGLGQAMDVKTHVWTTARHGVVASHSVHSIGRVVLAQSQLGSLTLSELTSRAKAFHDSRGFHAVTSTDIGGLTFTPPAGPAQTFRAPTPDHPVTIPGLVTVYAGRHATHRSSTGASATSFALRVNVLATGASVQLARSHAALDSGLTVGILGGRSAATHVVTAGNGSIRSGQNPLSLMPCQGTYGKTLEKSLASIDLGGQLVVKGASSLERGSQGRHRAHGVSRAEVTQVSLGGQVVVDGIVGRVSVLRTPDGVTRSTRGTRLGSVTVAGQQKVFPKTGVLEIPGVARLERRVVTRTPIGISVIGLRITMLDGSGAVVNLAEAHLKIRRLQH